MSTPWNRLRSTLRKLALTPTFTLVALVTLGLAIGANTAVFSVVNGILLEPLPFPQPERLVSIWYSAPGLDFPEIPQSPAFHFTYRDSNRTLEGIGMWAPRGATVTGVQEPERVDGMVVTHDIFPTLGLQPLVGRFFGPDDDTVGAAPTAVLGEAYWRERFGADPGIVGRSVDVNGTPTEIIGVAPAGHELAVEPIALYYPFRFDLEELFVGNFSYQALARMRPGVTTEQVRADIDRMWPTAFDRFRPGITLEMMRQAEFTIDVRPLKEDVVGDIGNTLWVLLGAVGLVLAIACANVANLFLVRAEGRQLEVAVRSALGASRAQIARGFLGESLLLGALGGLLGVGLARTGIVFLQRNAPQGLPRVDQIGLDAGVLVYTAAISLVAGVLFGLVPVLRTRSDVLASTLKEGGRGGSAGKERLRARNALVVAQVALALVLLVGSGLMFRTFQAMQAVDPGFGDTQDLLTLRLTIPPAEIPESLEIGNMHMRIRERLAAVPGVSEVSLTTGLPLTQMTSADPVYVDGFPIPEDQIPPIRRFHWVSDGHLANLRTPVLAGREFTRVEIEQRTPVVVVSESFALEHWDSPAQAIGERLRLPDFGPEAEPSERVWRTIVGVAADVRYDGVDRPAPTSVYWPTMTSDFWGEADFVQASQVYAIRSPRTGQPGFLEEVRRAIWEVNPNLPVASVRTMDEIVDRSMARTSFTMVLVVLAGTVALVLGTVGIYGVTSYVVAQRTREIGVRMALGAQRRDVSGLVLRQGLIVTGVGLALGLVAAAALTRLMSAILFEVNPLDPVTYVGVALALLAVAAAACWVPARRASSIDPVVALRFD